MKQITFLLALLCVVPACDWSRDVETAPRFAARELTDRIVTVSYPLQYLTQRIATNDLIIEFPAAESDVPRNWKPTIDEIANIQKADLIITNGPGIDYANWLIKVTLPDSKICATSEALSLQDFIKVKGVDIVHSHGPEGEHSHPFMVAYSWLGSSHRKEASKPNR